MSNDVLFGKVTGEVFGFEGLGNVVDSVVLTSGINEIPACIVSLHKDVAEATSQKAFPAETASAIAAYQTARLGGDLSKFAEVYITVENLPPVMQRLEFKGIPLSPAVSVSSGVYNVGVTLIHPLTNINMLQPYIYGPVKPPTKSELKSEGPAGSTTVAEATTATGDIFVQRMHQIFVDRMAYYAQNRNSWFDKNTTDMVTKIDSTNKLILPAFGRIARDSTEATYTGLSDLASKPGNVGAGSILSETINNTVSDYLTMGGENFMTILLAMCDSTQSFFQPPSLVDTQRPFGRVRPFRIMFEPPAKEMEVEASFVNFSEQNMSSDAVTGVLVTGVPYYQTGEDLQSEKEDKGFVPFENYRTFQKVGVTDTIAGKVITVPSPAWLPPEILERDVVNLTEVRRRERSLPAFSIKKKANAADIAAVYDKVYTTVLEEYASNILASVQLAPFQAQLRIPLDFTWEPGERYSIKINRGDNGAPIKLEGFLSKVTHEVRVASQGSSSFTELSLSYVKLLP